MTKEMPYTGLMLCVNFRAGEMLPSCGQRDAGAIAAEIKKGIDDRNIPLKVEMLHCMGKCHIGPTMRLAPGGPFIMGAKMADIPHILDMLDAGKFEELAVEFPLDAPGEYD